MKRAIGIISFFIILFLAIGNFFPPDAQAGESIFDALNPDGATYRGPGGVRSENKKPSVNLDVKFKKASAILAPEEIGLLDEFGDWIMTNGRGYVFKIVGHTCDLGSRAFNLTLSLKRAQAVQNYVMEKFGFPEAQFEIEGFGEDRPLIRNTDENTRKKNRRVEIVNTLIAFNQMEIKIPAISTRVECKRNGILREVHDGDALTRDDDYAITFQSDTKAHVLIYQEDATGEKYYLFPNSDYSGENNPVEARVSYRVPKHGKWFFLDNNKGKEEIVVLASKDPLPRPGETKEPITRGVKGVREGLPNITQSPHGRDEDKIFTWRLRFIHK